MTKKCKDMKKKKLGLKRGDEARITGLVGRTDLNGEKCHLFKWDNNVKRWAVALPNENVLIKPKNLTRWEDDDEQGIRSKSISILKHTTMPSPLFGLSPVKDDWNLTVLNDSSPARLKKAAARANTTPEAAEKAVFLELHENNAGYEAMAFPWLFPYGTGHFAQDRPVDMRFEEYVLHLLKLSTGSFLEDERWLDFAVNRAAILRFATGLPPMYQKEQENSSEGEIELDETRITMLRQFRKAFPKKEFCLRYLVGDKMFLFLVRIVMYKMTAKQRADVFMKE